MTVGIITMHRVYNYGSFLQAYALKKILEKIGYDVVFVDYKVEKPIIHNFSDRLKYLKGIFQKAIFFFLDDIIFFHNIGIIPESIRYAAKSHHSYKTEYWKVLGINRKKNYNSDVDVLIIGSDEVFNCLQTNVDVGYSRQLFGYDLDARKIITYAASCGNTTLQEIRQVGIDKNIQKDFSKISAFSVRDKNTFDIVAAFTGREDIIENLDPVLIHDFSEISYDRVDISDYIIVYAYRGRLKDAEIMAIKRFANNNNKKIVCIGGYHDFCDMYIQESPLKIFSYFKQADYVITDTFHGTIFSIINHARVGIFVRDGHGGIYGNSEKLTDLIKRLGLEKRVIDNLSDMEEILKADIDYTIIDAAINKEREKAFEYLRKNLALR